MKIQWWLGNLEAESSLELETYSGLLTLERSG